MIISVPRPLSLAAQFLPSGSYFLVAARWMASPPFSISCPTPRKVLQPVKNMAISVRNIHAARISVFFIAPPSRNQLLRPEQALQLFYKDFGEVYFFIGFIRFMLHCTKKYAYPFLLTFSQ